MAEGSGVLDEKEMKRQLHLTLGLMSPEKRKKWLEEMTNNEI